LALDSGLVAALEQEICAGKDNQTTVHSHPDAIYAGAIGAALWGVFRFEKLLARGEIQVPA
jgi:benzoyl-CoA reductase subunit D